MNVKHMGIFPITFTIPFLYAGDPPPRPQLSKRESVQLAQRVTKAIDVDKKEVEVALGETIYRTKSYHTAESRLEGNPIEGDAIKEELMRWALEELSARHNTVKEEKDTEKRKRILASIAAIVGGIATIATPIITYFLACDDSCSCGQ